MADVSGDEIETVVEGGSRDREVRVGEGLPFPRSDSQGIGFSDFGTASAGSV